MSYIVHEHSKYTSAIDKYWIFNNLDEGLKFLHKMVENYKDCIDYELYEEIYEDIYEEIKDKENFEEKFKNYVFTRIIDNNFDEQYIVLSKDDYLKFNRVTNN